MIANNMANSAKKTLVHHLEQKLIPLFESWDFEQVPSHELSTGAFSKKQFPLSGFKRVTDSGEVHLIDIKFEKRGGPFFEIMFAKIPRQGAFSTNEMVTQENASTHGVGHFGILQQSRFRTFRDFGSRSSSKCADFVINDVLEKVQQIRDWFTSGIVGPNLRTTENLSDGANITRGYPTMFFLREVGAGYSIPMNGSQKFHSQEDVREFAKKHLETNNRSVRFGIYWPWQEIRS